MLQNFTVVDVVGSLEASLEFALILFIPGYVIGWLSNVFSFRKRPFPMQVLLSSPLAVAVLPILVYLLGRYPRTLWTLFGATWLAFLLFIPGIAALVSQARKQFRSRTAWIGAAFVLGWATLAVATLVDLQFKYRLYVSTTAYDYSTRTAFTAAAVRAIPPSNPFFAANPPIALRYHYFWMLLCSLVVRLGHVGPKQAMYGGTVWAGIALMSLIVISLEFFTGVRERFQQRAFIGVALLLVTGLDILPNLYIYLHWHQVAPDMEWWNAVQITSWIDSLLWVPHHVMGLVACMVGVLVLQCEVSTRFQRAIAILIAGLAFASSAGLSILVTFTFAVFAVLWLLLAAHRNRWGEVAVLMASGVVGLLIGLPYLSTLLEPALDGSGGGGRFFALGIREFSFGTNLLASIFHFLPMTWVGWELLLLLLLPLNYFFELGFFLIVAAVRMRSIRLGRTEMSRQEEMAWVLVGTSFLVGTFFRSTTIDSNDLGWRCFLPAQLIFLVWAAPLIEEWWSTRRVTVHSNAIAVFMGALLVTGLVGTAYQVVMLRIYPILVDRGTLQAGVPWLDHDRRLGERTYALRSVYDSLGKIVPADAVVQYNPYAAVFIPHQLYSDHDAAIGQPSCGANFGGELARCAGRAEAVAVLFGKPSASESASLDVICRKYRIDVMLVDDNDPVWKDPNSWAWSRKPLLANDHVRALACGDDYEQTHSLSSGEEKSNMAAEIGK
jgi:hypothetical protein